ncbi:hypothetical protein F5Y04DRAFT_293562 [Hypomontagnella monticulosa]|nr:hypothetical protein F5Y04DRAFT_293562 [Hypomontagnella monticulosa]
MLRPMMPLDDSHLSRLSATEKPDFPSPVSSSEFSSKITSSKPATTTVLPDSPAPSTHTFDNRDPENRSVLESDRASISTADPVTPKLNTFPLTPPETPERASTRPKPNTQIPSSALSTLSEQSEHQLPRSPAQEHSVRRTDSSEELLVSEEPLVSEELLVFEEPLVSEEPASELIASPSTSDLSISDIEQSDSEESRPPSPRRGTIRYYIRLLLDTLAPSRKRRAKARKPDSKGLPPDVKSVIRLMREVGEGKHMSTQLSSRRKLSPSGYQILLDRLEKDQVLSDYVDNELGGYRFYYSHTEKQFTVYMKTALHDTFAICVHDIIRDFLKECERSEHEIIKNIAQRIQSIGSSGVGSCDLGDPEPDMSYQFQERESPGLIIEVAWGNGISLEEKAKGYFEMAGGETRTVIGFDLNAIYGKQAAAESKWKVLRTNWKLGKSPFCPEDVVLLDPEADKMTANFSVWRLDEKNVLQKVPP